MPAWTHLFFFCWVFFVWQLTISLFFFTAMAKCPKGPITSNYHVLQLITTFRFALKHRQHLRIEKCKIPCSNKPSFTHIIRWRDLMQHKKLVVSDLQTGSILFHHQFPTENQVFDVLCLIVFALFWGRIRNASALSDELKWLKFIPRPAARQSTAAQPESFEGAVPIKHDPPCNLWKCQWISNQNGMMGNMG